MSRTLTARLVMPWLPARGARDADNPGCSLIGISKSSILETDALAGVTVLSGVGFRSPHNGCQG